jgi:hypothetical protein
MKPDRAPFTLVGEQIIARPIPRPVSSGKRDTSAGVVRRHILADVQAELRADRDASKKRETDMGSP